jgi:hypothetical protein
MDGFCRKPARQERFAFMIASSILCAALSTVGLLSILVLRVTSISLNVRSIYLNTLLALLAGIQVNYAVTLAFGNVSAFFYCALLSASVLTALLIAKATVWPGAANLYSQELTIDALDLGRNYGISFLLSTVLFSTIMFYLVGLPISAWDARSIWFFHAKMMYFGEALPFSFWPSELDFANHDYPNLFPLIAAQVAAIAGYWNEYVPLTALMILSFVEIFSIFYLAPPLMAMSILALFYLYFVLSPMNHATDTPLFFYTNGYMDLHLALISMAVVLAMWRTRGNLDLPESILLILLVALIASLKNEGLILSIIILVGLGGTQLLNNDSRNWIRYSALAGVALAPAVAWRLLLHLQHISTEFISPTWGPFRDVGLFGRLVMRANPDSLSQIAWGMKAHIVLALYFAIVFINIIRRRQSDLGMMFFFSHVPILYYIFLALVFMAVPQDLNFWLSGGADRYILPTIAMLLASIGALCTRPGVGDHSSL